MSFDYSSNLNLKMQIDENRSVSTALNTGIQTGSLNFKEFQKEYNGNMATEAT
jgi:nanoRNase/pAp phosphatase (c-di-AMP/oligoRNAs hydrolase)